MISSEVQRTLVKSPPELWAELGDPASLARHLGELGEIRITRIEPEQAVEWEAQDTSGTVLIKPSAWGTKVTLTATRETPSAATPLAAHPPTQADHTAEPEAAVEIESEPAVEVEPDPTPQPEPAPAVEVEPEPTPQPEPAPAVEVEPEPTPQPEPAPAVEVEPEPQPVIVTTVVDTSEADPELVPRRGFFSRLFSRRPRQAAVQPQPTETATGTSSWSEPAVTVRAPDPQPIEPPEPLAEEPVARAEPQPAEPVWAVAKVEPQTAEPAALPQPQPAEQHEAVAEPEQIAEPVECVDGQPQEISQRLEEAEEAAAGEVTAVLTAVLDRLGAAHHRPFSRG